MLLRPGDRQRPRSVRHAAPPSGESLPAPSGATAAQPANVKRTGAAEDGRPELSPEFQSNRRWHAGCNCRCGLPMEYRPRVVVALQDRAECAAVADWLTARVRAAPRSGPGPNGRPTPRSAHQATSGWAIGGLRKAERARNTRVPVTLIGNTPDPPKGADR